MSIVVGGVERFSLVDYPGQISAAVFMQGCPWKCPFCHNSSLIEIKKETDFDWSKFVEFLKTRTHALDAVVFSGGEPLVQKELINAISEVKALGYKIGLHTGGYRPEIFKQVLPMLSWVGFDIKAPFEEIRYQKVTGSNHLKDVLESLTSLIASGTDFECRTTCDPRILSLEDIRQIAQDLKKLGVKNYYLQKYRPIDSDRTTQEFECEKFSSPELLNYLKSLFSQTDFRK